MMKKAILYTSVTLLVAVLLYACFLIPFTLPGEFQGNEDFAISSTIAAIFITLFSIVGNGLICFTLTCGSNANQSLNFLVVSMAIADMLLPLFHYPIRLAIIWISQEDLWLEINLGSFFDSIKYLKCLSYGLASLSIVSATMICVIQFYQVVRKQYHTPTLLKVASSFFVFSLSVVTSIIIYKYFDEEWSHAFIGATTYYIPMALMFVLMLASCLITECSTRFDEENSDQYRFLYSLFIAYLVLWLPFYSVQVLHKYCCRLDYHHLVKATFFTKNLWMVKGCFNVLLLAYFDKRFKYTVTNMMKTTCLGYRRTESVQFVDNREFSIRYSASEHDVTLEFDDERHLIA